MTEKHGVEFLCLNFGYFRLVSVAGRVVLIAWCLVKKIFHLEQRKGRTPLGAKCSFCGKGHEEVKKLIAGPEIYICNECIDLSSDLITEELAKHPGR